MTSSEFHKLIDEYGYLQNELGRSIYSLSDYYTEEKIEEIRKKCREVHEKILEEIYKI